MSEADMYFSMKNLVEAVEKLPDSMLRLTDVSISDMQLLNALANAYNELHIVYARETVKLAKAQS